MSFRRYEILLPTRYNDGAPVEAEKFHLVIEELAIVLAESLSILNTCEASGFIKAKSLKKLMCELWWIWKIRQKLRIFSPATNRYSRSASGRSTFGLCLMKFELHDHPVSVLPCWCILNWELH